MFRVGLPALAPVSLFRERLCKIFLLLLAPPSPLSVYAALAKNKLGYRAVIGVIFHI